MALLLILPSEWAILAKRCPDEGEPDAPIMHAIDSDVFNYCCTHTDWATGRIGQYTALSYAGIATALNEDIPRKPNRSLRQVKRRCVRNSVERLIKVGLFVRQSLSKRQIGVNQNRLILDRPFWCELLLTEDSTTNPDSRQIAGLMMQLLKNKAFNNSSLAKFATSHATCSYHPVSICNPNSITNPQNAVFRLSLTWQPDRKLVDLFLQASGFAGKQIEKVWFGKYVQYWSGQPVMRTQQEWSEHFANHMQNYLLRPGYFEEVNGIVKIARDGTQ